jgi:hypothetical protein
MILVSEDGLFLTVQKVFEGLMFMSAYEFPQEILNADMQAHCFLQMIYFDFAGSF